MRKQACEEGKVVLRVWVKRVNLLIVFLLTCSSLLGAVQSFGSANSKCLEPQLGDRAYSFLVFGHVRGDLSRSPWPASTFMAALPHFKKGNADFLVLLGDLLWKPKTPYISNLKKVLDGIELPVYVARGNHDVMENRSSFEAMFGFPWGAFSCGLDRFVFLDTQSPTRGEVSGKQLAFLFRELQTDRKKVRNLFIFSHDLCWVVDEELLEPVYEGMNWVRGGRKTWYEKQVKPRLKAAVDAGIRVFWISGDIGANRQPPILYWPDSDTGVTYLATGLGDRVRDAGIRVEVNTAGVPRFLTIPLAGYPMKTVSEYNLSYWVKLYNARPRPNPKARGSKYQRRHKPQVSRTWVGFLSVFNLCFSLVLGLIFFRGRQARRAIEDN